MTIRYDGQVAIVTGAGNGLGRSHALQLAARGAKVVVNDLGGTVDGSGGGSSASQAVVAEIEAAGGEAMAHGANVANFEDVQDMVAKTMELFRFHSYFLIAFPVLPAGPPIYFYCHKEAFRWGYFYRHPRFLQ